MGVQSSIASSACRSLTFTLTLTIADLADGPHARVQDGDSAGSGRRGGLFLAPGRPAAAVAVALASRASKRPIASSLRDVVPLYWAQSSDRSWRGLVGLGGSVASSVDVKGLPLSIERGSGRRAGAESESTEKTPRIISI